MKPALTPYDPGDADAWWLKGNVLQQTGQVEESITCYQHAIELRPGFAEAFNNLAAALRAVRRAGRALQAVERALSLRPKYAQALNNRGLILLDGRQGMAAVESFRQALTIEPRFPAALHNLGTALMQLQRFTAAADAFARLAAIAPHFNHVQGNLLHAKLCCCDWMGFDDAAQTVAQSAARGEHADTPMSFMAVSDSAPLQLRCAQLYSDAYYPSRPSGRPATPRDPRRERVRVAYLSADLGEHAVSYLLAGVFERHDASRFETFGVAWGRQHEESELRHRVQRTFARFYDVSEASDDDVAKLLSELEVDIAVDLTGHTRDQRTGILARRAAPVQVSFLGYAGTSGAPYIDYLIGDEVVIPRGEERWYSEQVVRLPHCYLPNDDRRAIAPRPRRAEAGLPQEGVVFCAFTNPYKINPAMFSIWMNLLKATPGSVLWLRAMGKEAQENLQREAAGRGVEGGRLIFAPHVAQMADHLARQSLADLYLDTLPYNAHSTACDALWSGVPVLSCAGGSFAGRVAGSALTAVGLPELIAQSLAAYERKALELAHRPQELARLRRHLEQQRTCAPLFDTARFTRHLESAYETMHERAVRGQSPTAFAIA